MTDQEKLNILSSVILTKAPVWVNGLQLYCHALGDEFALLHDKPDGKSNKLKVKWGEIKTLSLTAPDEKQ